ncbi:hypothetical protein [Metabacillus niabensis]|uniref:Phage protein n=1 Tax=Metabacillus niabensis TaxID=324854 RepID=A0ABT9Z2U7_9BACI|nr:hypothetical protein [Metabacillus niabensis]MDQ0226584.1 hypothetical protein [Metabacillus niabensis]
MPKICEVCGRTEEHQEEEAYDIYGVCDNCMKDRYVDVEEQEE